MSIKIIPYFLVVMLPLCMIPPYGNKDELKWQKTDLQGHWKLYDTEIVDEVPFLNLHAPVVNNMNKVSEDSPWDSYSAFDLVFEADSMYMINYPIEALTPVHYMLDSGYLHLKHKDYVEAYPIEIVNDTLICYRPIRSESGYFKEKYLRTHFNDSVLNILKKYGINYPELAGIWHLVREEDYDYGTHYELKFPHSIPDSINISKEQMISALKGDKVYRMITDGVKRDYSFSYRKNHIYFTPGKWYKGDDPHIHFYRN